MLLFFSFISNFVPSALTPASDLPPRRGVAKMFCSQPAPSTPLPSSLPPRPPHRNSPHRAIRSGYGYTNLDEVTDGPCCRAAVLAKASVRLARGQRR